MSKYGSIRYEDQAGILIHLGRLLELIFLSFLSEKQRHSDSGYRVVNHRVGIFAPEIRVLCVLL